MLSAIKVEPRRFTELLQAIEKIAQKTLTIALRELERDGFVSRRVYASMPPRVECALTELGTEMREPVVKFDVFAARNSPPAKAAIAIGFPIAGEWSKRDCRRNPDFCIRVIQISWRFSPRLHS